MEIRFTKKLSDGEGSPNPEQALERIAALRRAVGLRPTALEDEDVVVPPVPRGYLVTPNLYVSHWIPAFNKDFLERFGIRSILSLDGKLKPDVAPSLGVEQIVSFDMPDGPGTTARMMKDLVDILAELTEKHSPVLVHCNAGQSRSPAVVAAYLAIREKMPLPEALRTVRLAREPLQNVKYWPEVLEAIREAVGE